MDALIDISAAVSFGLNSNTLLYGNQKSYFCECCWDQTLFDPELLVKKS